VQRP
jgi:4a-hydroxytetrahydrobiopterin dehydratase